MTAGDSILGVTGEDLLKFLSGLVGPTGSAESECKIAAGLDVIRVNRQRLTEFTHSFIKSSLGIQRDAQMVYAGLHSLG